MTRHERIAARVLPQYEVDTLGAPFKVTVCDCVTLKIDPATGKELVNIPDLVGLINAVVRARVKHPRKLNGAEIRFIRNALGVKAHALAGFLDMSPEHFSRCESGTKVMSSISEKVLRLFAFVASYHPNPEELLARSLDSSEVAKEIEKKAKKPDEFVRKFTEQFLTMKIHAAFDTNEELHFAFSRDATPPEEDTLADHDQDAEWGEPKVCCMG